jgi:hypothetical protein
MHHNYDQKFTSRRKFVFVPNDECNKRGEYLLKWGATLPLPDYFFHYRPGGHVDALHQHLENAHFFRIDLRNFFYSCPAIAYREP